MNVEMGHYKDYFVCESDARKLMLLGKSYPFIFILSSFRFLKLGTELSKLWLKEYFYNYRVFLNRENFNLTWESRIESHVLT